MSDTPAALVPPHSAEAERAVLGAILRNPERYHTLVDRVSLRPPHFFAEQHRVLFQAMADLEAAGQPIDIITVSERVQGAGKKLSPQVLVELMENSPLTANVEFHGEIVRKKFFLRRIVDACQQTSFRAMRVDGDISSFVGDVEQEFLAITSEHDRGDGLVRASDVLLPTLEEVERRINAGGQTTGVPSGFVDLDRITGGWQRSDLIILAARPGMGKTALALNWALHALKAADKAAVAFFTLEMSKTQLMERLLSAEGRVDSARLRKGDLSGEDQDRLMHAARSLNTLGERLVIDETPGISITELRSRCRRFRKEYGLSLVLIDYLQLMSGSDLSKRQGREREISEISMGLKALAKELDVPVIAAAQLNRGPDARPDKRPKVSDLRESGSMEQDADQIMFVYRDEYYNPNSEMAGKSEVIVAKNRHGEVGSVYLAWLPNFVSFHNLAAEDS